MITQQATDVLRRQLRPQCKLPKSCGRTQELVIHRIPARKGAECELDVACSQRAEDGSRCTEVLRERPNAYASKDGQNGGVVTRSVDRSASARRCESTASKSGAIRPIWPSCKQHGVGYLRSSAKANSTSEDPCSQRCVPMRLLGSADRASLLTATCVCGVSLATTMLAPQGYKPQYPSRVGNRPRAYQQA